MRIVVLAAHASAWDYLSGGADWQEGVCSHPDVGAKQSPVSLPEAPTVDTAETLFYNYPTFEEPVKLYATGHALAYTFPDWYKAGFAAAADVTEIQEGTMYRLQMMHIHAPGEHRFGDVQPRLEVQLMHVKGYGVGGVAIPFVEGGEAHPFLTALLEQGLPTVHGSESLENVATRHWPMAELFAGAAFDSYAGSLTVPPCDPNVEWFVRAQPIAVSSEQLYQVEQAIKLLSPPRGNARDVQPLGDREVRKVAAVDFYSEDVMAAAVEALSKNQVPAGVEDDSIVNPADVLNNPIFTSIFHDDSAVMKNAKTSVEMAAQDVDGARVAVNQAKQALDNQQAMYNGADGLVGKISLMWSVIGAKAGYDASLAARAGATARYQAAFAEALDTIENEIRVMMAANSTTTTVEAMESALDKLTAERALALKAKEEAEAQAEALPRGTTSPTIRTPSNNRPSCQTSAWSTPPRSCRSAMKLRTPSTPRWPNEEKGLEAALPSRRAPTISSGPRCANRSLLQASWIL
jgi:carbonic anhydrase